MKKIMTLRLALILLAATSLTGCGLQRVVYRPSIPQEVQSYYAHDIILAGDFIQQQQPQDSAKSESDADEGTQRSKTETQTPDEKASADSDETPDKAKKGEMPPYTAPSAGVQQFAFVAVGVAAFGVTDVAGAGREASESAVTIVDAVVGRPGLSAPTQRINSAVVGRPGLQQGFAAGLGSAGSRNIFTARSNPASGANGRCQDLISAGFFNGNRGTCEASFQRKSRSR